MQPLCLVNVGWTRGINQNVKEQLLSFSEPSFLMFLFLCSFHQTDVPECQLKDPNDQPPNQMEC